MIFLSFVEPESDVTGDESSTTILGVFMYSASALLTPFGEECRDLTRAATDEAEEDVAVELAGRGLFVPSLSPPSLGESDRRGELVPEDVADDLRDGASFFCWIGGATAEGVDELELKLAAFAFVATAARDEAREGLGS